jgi:hypothetical protein
MREVMAAKHVMRQSLFAPPAPPASDGGVWRSALEMPLGAWLPLAISIVAVLLAVLALVVAAIR